MAGTQLATRSQKDALDSFFEWTERLVCPVDDGGKPAQSNNRAIVPSEPDEDLLDYTFTAVESFTCNDDRAYSSRRGGGGGGCDNYQLQAPSEPSYLTRDNSLVESLPGSAVPTTRAVQRPRRNDNDMIDYVFEHVESFVCTDDMPMPSEEKSDIREFRIPATTNNNTNSSKNNKKSKLSTSRINKRYQEEIYEPDDEIQLFFRPQR